MRKSPLHALAVLVLWGASFVYGPAATAQTVPINAASNTEEPTELATYGNGWIPKGSGALRFFGFKAYDATLWLANVQTPFAFSKPFALEIRYATTVKARDITNTSLVELQRISTSSPEQIAAFLNGKLIGESADVAFSEAFFKIWMDPKTKRKDLRSALLALPAESTNQ